MNYLYPTQLKDITKTEWNKLQRVFSRKGTLPPFPKDEYLMEMLDVLYHVSFLTEESRRVGAKVIYIEPNGMEKFLNSHNQPYKLIKFVDFSVGELLKISPAINPNNSMIVICPEKAAIPDGKDKLVIWGVLFLGDEYFDLMSGKSDAALSPPNFLTLSVDSPGSITASTSGKILYRLNAGNIVFSPLKSIGEGVLGDFLSGTADSLYNEVCTNLGIDKFSDSDSDDHPKTLYYKSFSNILKMTREYFHGGTFLVIPEDIQISDDRIKDRLKIKYTIEPMNLWELLIDECTTYNKYFKNAFSKELDLVETRENHRLDKRRENIRKKIYESQGFISSLSGVDGAVLVNRKFEVLGFGAEILATSNVEYVKKANNPTGTEYDYISVNSFGTRHRSAIRFCSSFEQSIAFVVSQDGSLRAIKRNGPDLFLWNDIHLDNYGY